MIIGIGTDIVDVPRIKAAHDQYGERFLSKIFTPTEIAYCDHFGDTRFLHYAARFAAKEAFSKAIKTGMRDGMSFKLVGIVNEKSGEPRIELFGAMLERWGSYKIHVSLSHTAAVGLAVVVISDD
ncbi:MAG TPA: holo-[acyl-carrier-protein] synthase, partial [Bacteroidetes bacterium]|nr:holo-[acyl-carrier-protein] synthase [Bacteroidota bacterium]